MKAFAKLLVVLVAVLCVSACSKDPRANGPAPFGAECRTTEDCSTGYCVQTLSASGLPSGAGVCSRTCQSDSDCPSSRNWGCASTLDYTGRVCACAMDASYEICGDGADNDCNGLVDDCQICAGAFVPKDDPANCGACGHACSPTQVCSLGTCGCRPGATACGDACTDLKTDPTHCGTCDTVCAPNQGCVDGACGCQNPTATDVCPGVGCVNFATDAQNCGSCGHACATGQTCTSGNCACPPGRTDSCGGACVDTQTDSQNCGDCGVKCRADQTCSDSSCACPSLTPDDCNGQCVDKATDTSNCGGCGVTCGPGQSCVSSACSCDVWGYLACPDGCYDMGTDAFHCGGCNTVCGEGETCSYGVCTCASGLHCNGACVAVDDNQNCGGCGNVCTGGTQCYSGNCECLNATDILCNGTCVSPQYDASNCGGCGNVCPAGQTCNYGTCGCAYSGYTYCAASGQCVDTYDDAANCGACGNACHTGQSCSYGNCACDVYGQTYCASASACVSLYTDAAHCGTCTTACRSGETCSQGNCLCPTSGQTWCANTGTCTDTLSNAAHCGDCNTACHTGETCSYGNCTCPNSGEKWCQNTGKCTDTQANATNCGDCGVVCPGGTSCSYGQCTCTDPKKTLCTSTCVDLQTDAKHCGDCLNACPGNLICSAGTCVCKDPTASAAVRLTTTSASTGNPSAAWDGTHLGVAYTEDAGTTVNLMFALLNADGTRAKATDTVVASYAASPDGIAGVVGRPYLIWSGTEYAVVWTQSPGLGSNLAFRRLDATGATKGAIVVVSDPNSAVYANPSIAWSSTYGGYAVAYTGGTLNFRRIGADGSNPDPENKVDVISIIGFPDSRTRTVMTASADGRFGVLLNFAYNGQLLTLFNADGSRTVAPVNLYYYYAYNPGDLVWDGSAFLAAYTDGASTITDNRTSTQSGGATVPAPSTTGSRGSVALDVDKTVVTVAWTEAADTQSPYGLWLRRYTLPAGATSTLTPVTGAVQVVTTQTIPDAQSMDMARSGATSLGVVWADNRWGAATELYYAKVDIGSCP